jgi:ABC-type multidrug transport system fused ATPase/permease subunit
MTRCAGQVNARVAGIAGRRGSLSIGGAHVCDLDLRDLRSAVGVVTQRTEIIAGTLAENIARFADRPRQRLESAITELDLAEWVDGLPNGLDTNLGPGGSGLSPGSCVDRLSRREVVEHHIGDDRGQVMS